MGAVDTQQLAHLVDLLEPSAQTIIDNAVFARRHGTVRGHGLPLATIVGFAKGLSYRRAGNKRAHR
jgi:hypothetical protein